MQDSPVGYWPMDETTGATIFDRSGNGRNGTWSGSGVGARTTILGKAPDFAGSYATISDNAAFSASGATGKLTIEAWVVADTFSNDMMIVTKGDVSNFEYRLNSHGNNELRYIASDAGGVSEQGYVGPSLLVAGRLHHVAVVYDREAATVTLFVDGVAGSAQANIKTQGDYTAQLQIGRRADGGGALWDGVIQHVAIYQAALSTQRLAAHYQAGIRAGTVMG